VCVCVCFLTKRQGSFRGGRFVTMTTRPRLVLKLKIDWNYNPLRRLWCQIS